MWELTIAYMMSPEIKIFFLRGGQANANTASYNRFLMLRQMVMIHFDTEVMGLKSNEKARFWNIGISRPFSYRLNILRSAFLVPASNKNQQNVIFLLSTYPFIFLLVWLISKVKKNKIINERNEFPETIRRGIPWRNWIFNNTVLWWQYRLIDGLFLMTDELIKFYTPLVKSSCLIQKLPMMVDFERFKLDVKPVYSNEYIFYGGSLSQKKDGVESLVRAFEKVSMEFPGLQLWIAGGKKQSDETHHLDELVSSLKLQNRVKLLGEVDRELIPDYLLSAKILVLPRPDSIQARGGFPTKLGEYLATKNPIIVTNVGEIPNYLTNKEVFFIDKFNIEKELTETLVAILKNPKNAIKVAEKGYEKAREIFSIESNSNKLKMMVTSLIH